MVFSYLRILVFLVLSPKEIYKTRKTTWFLFKVIYLRNNIITRGISFLVGYFAKIAWYGFRKSKFYNKISSANRPQNNWQPYSSKLHAESCNGAYWCSTIISVLKMYVCNNGFNFPWNLVELRLNKISQNKTRTRAIPLKRFIHYVSTTVKSSKVKSKLH